MEYEEYLAKCKKIRKENNDLLNTFAELLKDKGLSKKTVEKHKSNLDFYINEFLLLIEPKQPEAGVSGFEVDHFLGYYLIKKCMWGGKHTIKDYCAGLKKFYKFMLDKNRIEDFEYQELKETIKERKSLWLEEMEDWLDYDGPW
ncbi:MAG: recombinase [Candidatus Marinimicrobia bacterium]|nr:recombinase [Candidatus Neomarinimicrobiota bacterium]